VKGHSCWWLGDFLFRRSRDFYHRRRHPHQGKAITYALLAGDQAVRLHARAEATIHYAQALRLAQKLPASPEAQRLEIDAILKLAAVSASREDMERDQAHLAQAQTTAEALADDRRLGQVLYWRGRLAYVRGDASTAIAHAEQSLAIADRLGDEALSAPAVNLDDCSSAHQTAQPREAFATPG
jgi:tetratricopeptide (TPR) repeat protein